MKRFFAVGSTLLLFTSFGFSQRTPGRVAGSNQNPQANRVTAGPKTAAAAPAAPMSKNDVQEFQNAKAADPDLSEADFRELREYSRQLHAIGKDVSVVQLSSALHKHKGDIMAALKDSGVSGKQARSIVSEHRR
jgi:hypothetical protein